MEGDSFYALYCLKFNCPIGEFEKKVLWHCTDFQVAPLARIIWAIDPGYFADDVALINAVKDLTSFYKVRETVNFAIIQPKKKNFLRRYLRIRMSKGRLLRLAGQLFVEPD